MDLPHDTVQRRPPRARGIEGFGSAGCLDASFHSLRVPIRPTASATARPLGWVASWGRPASCYRLAAPSTCSAAVAAAWARRWLLARTGCGAGWTGKDVENRLLFAGGSRSSVFFPSFYIKKEQFVGFGGIRANGTVSGQCLRLKNKHQSIRHILQSYRHA